MRTPVIAAALALASWAGSAKAEQPAIFVSVNDAKCVVPPGPAGEYGFRFIKTAGDSTYVPVTRVRVNNTEVQSVVLGSIGGSFEVRFDTDTQKDLKVSCEAPGKPAIPGSTVPARTEQVAPAPASEDEGFEKGDAALAWLTQTMGIHGHAYKDGVWTIYNLPDGRPAFPLPPHVTEHQRVRLAIVLPQGAGARFTVDGCGGSPTFRPQGAFRHASSHGRGTEQRAFTLLDHATDLQCSENLTYTIEVRDHGVTTAGKSSLPIDSVQRFFVSAGVMFDFVSPERLSLQDRPAAGGGSEKYVELADHFAGFRPLITAGVYPCEANPHDWKVCNMFAPVIAVDVTRIDQGAGLGLQFMPIHGLGIVGGFDVYLSDHVPEKVNAKPGSTWTVPGDLPVDKRFDLDSLGGFVGAVVTLDVIGSIFH